MKFDLHTLFRKNIRELEPYRSARLEYTGTGAIFLDANENPFNDPLNRYPDPLHRDLREQLAVLKRLEPGQVFTGNGSDEAIDLLIRATCDPGIHNIVGIDPSYGMYRVAAAINGVEYRKAPLLEDFSLDPRIVLERVDEQTRLVFLCSPNNPSANLLDREAMLSLADRFHGLLVVDEAYIDFAPGGSLLPELEAYPNLVVLQTLSKAWGAAGIRLGMALASAEIVGLLDRIKYPYNLNSLSLEAARRLIGREKERQGWTRTILGERERLSAFLKAYVQTEQVYPSDANFILARFREAGKLKDWLQQHGIVVRDRSGETHCRGCLRISVGSPEENNELIKWLEKI